MKVLVANHSSYPPAFGGQTGSTDPQIDLRGVIEDQENAAIDVLTDGQLGWADPISHLMERLDGVRLANALERLDAGLRFRPPIIQAKLRCHGAMTVADYRRAAGMTRRPVKPVLVGPYTLARCSRIATTAYRDVSDLAADLSVILAQEIRDLVREGARLIQVEEPLILRHQEDIRLLRELLEPLKVAAGDECQLMLATYSGEAEPLYAQLNSLPADIIALDLVEGSAAADIIANTGSGRILALGVTDGRSTAMEDVASLTARIKRMLHRYIHDVV